MIEGLFLILNFINFISKLHNNAKGRHCFLKFINKEWDLKNLAGDTSVPHHMGLPIGLLMPRQPAFPRA